MAPFQQQPRQLQTGLGTSRMALEMLNELPQFADGITLHDLFQVSANHAVDRLVRRLSRTFDSICSNLDTQPPFAMDLQLFSTRIISVLLPALPNSPVISMDARRMKYSVAFPYSPCCFMPAAIQRQ